MFKRRKLRLFHYQSAFHERVDGTEHIAVNCETAGVSGDKRDLVSFSRSQGYARGKVVIDGEAVRLYWVKVADQNIDCLVSLEFDGWLASVDAIVESIVVQNNENVVWRSLTALCEGHVEGCDGQV